MKWKYTIILCMFVLLAGCGASPDINDTNINDTNDEETPDTDSEVIAKNDDDFKDVVGNWYFWTSENHFSNLGIYNQIPNSITFNSDSTFEYELYLWDTSSTESKTQKIQGTYSIGNNTISMFYNQTYKSGIDNEEIIEDKVNAKFSLIDNEIQIEGFGIYVKEGEAPNPLPDFSNEYSKKLEGYYVCTYINGKGNDYFYFNEKGQIIRIAYFNSEQNCEFDYVYTNITNNTIDGMVERCGGDSECSFESNYTINEDGDIDLYNSVGERWTTLTRTTKDVFEEVQKDTTYYIGDVYLILADALNVREKPSTSSKVVSTLKKNDIRYASYKLKVEPVQADGYTWYFIEENQWIADKNGEWVKKIR